MEMNSNGSILGDPTLGDNLCFKKKNKETNKEKKQENFLGKIVYVLYK